MAAERTGSGGEQSPIRANAAPRRMRAAAEGSPIAQRRTAEARRAGEMRVQAAAPPAAPKEETIDGAVVAAILAAVAQKCGPNARVVSIEKAK